MRHFIAFFKKEYMESVRSYKLFIVLVVYLLLGIMSPLVAKLTPELMAIAMPPEYMIQLPEPTIPDAWAQFYKNITQLGLIVSVIVGSSVLSSEIAKGTLVIMLTKGLSAATVMLSKYVYMLLLWTVALGIAFGTAWGYTVYLFPGETVQALLFSLFCLWSYGVLLFSVLMAAAAITRTAYGGLLLVGGWVVLLMLAGIPQSFGQFNPMYLTSGSLALLTGMAKMSDFTGALVITGVLSAVFAVLSVTALKKRML